MRLSLRNRHNGGPLTMKKVELVSYLDGPIRTAGVSAYFGYILMYVRRQNHIFFSIKLNTNLNSQLHEPV